jgi:hypothetical protein
MRAMNPITREEGIVVNSYFFKMNPHLWCGEYRHRAWLIPFWRRLMVRVIGFLGYSISNSDGGKECLPKEELENMPKEEKAGNIRTAACPKRKPTLN